MKTPSVKVPQPTAAEQALQTAQAQLLKQQQQLVTEQQEQQKILMPFLAEQAGFTVDIDPQTGKLRGITKKNDPLEEQRKRIEGLELDRSEKALRGELPVDPVLERELAEQEQTLRERLRSQFGAGYETSTSGIQTLDEFFRSAEGLRSDARTGQLTLAEQLSMARQGMGLESRGSGLGILSGATTGTPLALGQFGLNVAGGFGNAILPYQNNRQMGLQASMFNAQQSSASRAGWGQLAGTLFGTLMGGPIGGRAGRGLTGAGLF